MMNRRVEFHIRESLSLPSSQVKRLVNLAKTCKIIKTRYPIRYTIR